MPANALRIYVRYEKLYLSEFRALLRDIERAYNRVDAAAVESERIRRRRRLTVQVIETGRSIETIVLGSLAGIGLLYRVASKAIKLRHEHWAAEEQKWKAHEQKSKAMEAEQKLLPTKDGLEAINVQKLALDLAEDPRLLAAEKILTDRITRIQHSRTIESIEIEIGDSTGLAEEKRRLK